MSVIKSTGKLLGPVQARELTDCIKGTVEMVWELIAKAYSERAWSALGYASWDEYCEAEFGTTRLRLPREERTEVVASLRESGLSIRAIASATGLSKNTVQSDVSQIGTTAPGSVTASTPGQTDRVAAALAAARAKEDLAPVEPIAVAPEIVVPERIVGTDGKSYPKPTVSAKPRRGPLSNDAVRVSLEFNRVLNRLRKLVDDDRFAANTDSIGRQFRPYLPAALDVINRLNDAVEKPVIEPESDTDVEHQEQRYKAGDYFFGVGFDKTGPEIWINPDPFVIDDSITPEIAADFARSLKSALPTIHATIERLERRAGESR